MATQSVFELSVHDLMHKPGHMRELKLDITIPTPLGNAVTAVKAGDVIDLDLRPSRFTRAFWLPARFLATPWGSAVAV